MRATGRPATDVASPAGRGARIPRAALARPVARPERNEASRAARPRPRTHRCSASGRSGHAGCKLEKFHPFDWRHIGVFNERDHRKIVVVDGRTAFVGGHCIVDSWLGCAEDGKNFADVSARLRGPIVHSVQAAFSENWVGQTSEPFMGDEVFPSLERAGDVTAHAAT